MTSRNSRFQSGSGGQRRSRPRYFARRKVCQFCVDKVEKINYKQVDILRGFLSDRYKIEARRRTGVCARHQRAMSRAVKRARSLSLIPYAPSHKGAVGLSGSRG
jgi:small subunit ribosomal protein S18